MFLIVTKVSCISLVHLLLHSPQKPFHIFSFLLKPLIPLPHPHDQLMTLTPLSLLYVGKGTKKLCNTEKTNNKIALINPTQSVITLNVNKLNTLKEKGRADKNHDMTICCL